MATFINIAVPKDNSSDKGETSPVMLPPTPPGVEVYEARQRRQGIVITGFAIIAALVLGLLFTMLQLDSPLVPIVACVCIITPLLVWHIPRMTLWITFASVCLFEMFQTPYPDALTDRIPFFWNVNTILQVYAHTNFKAVPLNLMEVFLLVAGVSALLKNIYLRTLSFDTGPLIKPFGIYMGFVLMAWANGIATGGDFKISLQEVRSQFYFFMAYLIVVNFLRERKHMQTLCWISIVCIGLKGVLYTFRRYVTLKGLPLPDQGVGSHEEAFLFDTLVVLLLNLGFCRTEPRMQKTIWLLMPTILLGQLACNRRAGIAALIILLPMLFMAAYRALPSRRRIITTIALVGGIGFSIYYPIFKNSDSMLALPARAVKSQFAPDTRDAASNAYRDAENMDQMATIHLSPIIGYGYGKRFLHAVPIADIANIYEWWDILPHNQILWVWMRTGTLGFIAFWMLMASIIVRACRLLSRTDLEPFDKAMVLQVFALVIMLLIFGLLDLQLSNYRDMTFVGIFVGVLGSRLFPRNPDAPAGAIPVGAFQRRSLGRGRG